VLELYATAEAMQRHPELTGGADQITEKDAAALSETKTPQGLVAVCALTQPSAEDVLARSPRLLVALVEPNDPGNLGAVIRTADAAGADAVFVDGGVDCYNGKVVRATAGSLFHLPIVESATLDLLTTTAAAGIAAFATTGAGGVSLDALADDGRLAAPTLWLFGTEAHGLPEAVVSVADQAVRIPVHGRAESLNLAAAAAVCLYASARAQRGSVR
jgi:TrmH family RNA methyltransferase